MAITTGSYGTLKYAWEETYANLYSSGNQSSPNKKFGIQDKVSSWTIGNNRIDLAELNQTELANYAYGTQAGSLSVDFVLSNPWVLRGFYGIPTVATGSPNVWTWQKSGTKTKDVSTFTTEIGIDIPATSNDIRRTLKGCMMRSLTINATIGGTVDCSADIAYAEEDAPSTSGVAVATEPTVEFPYTFAHATIKQNNVTLGKVQDLSITFAQNSDFLYGLGSHQAVDSFRRVFDITGSFKISLQDKTNLEHVLNQIAKGTAGTYSETIDTSAPYLEIKFLKDANEEIKLTLTGISLTDLGISGLEPVEPIFEDVTWRAKSCVCTAENNQSSEE